MFLDSVTFLATATWSLKEMDITLTYAALREIK
jgi:hypothetical protein